MLAKPRRRVQPMQNVGPKYIPIGAFYTQFLSDASSGNLPAVSFVDPRFTLTDDGTGNNDHRIPTSDQRQPCYEQSLVSKPKV